MDFELDDTPFQAGELTDSSSERSLDNATSPNHNNVEHYFRNAYDHPSDPASSTGLDHSHGLPSENTLSVHAWASTHGIDDPANAIHGLPGCDAIISRIVEPKLEDDEDPKIPWEKDTRHCHQFAPANPWGPNHSTTTEVSSSRRGPSDLKTSMALGQPLFTPVEGAAPLTSLAPRPDSVSPESDESDHDVEVTTEGSDFEQSDAPPTHSKAVRTLHESYCRFGKTTTWASLYNSDGVTVPAKIIARFRSKSLDKTSASVPHYITYRRNYFSNEMSFVLRPPTESTEGKLYVDYEDAKYPVQCFGVRMRAVDTDEQGEEVEISVFTPKRDRPIVPTPALEQRLQPNMPSYINLYNESTGFGSNKEVLPSYYTTVHNQFRQATKNNGNRRRQQSYYRIVVELRVLILGPAGDEIWVKIASKMSAMLVVRGRCPGSFADDPNYQKKKKGRKLSHKRHDPKASRSMKQKGPPKPNSYRISKKVGNQRIPGYSVNSVVPSTMPCLTSEFRSYASTNNTPFSVKTPSQVSPRDEIRKSLHLTNPDEWALPPAVPVPTGYFLTKNHGFQAFKNEDFALEYGMLDPLAGELAEMHESHLAPLDRYGFGVDHRSYADLHALPTARELNTNWVPMSAPFAYAE